MRMKQVVMLLVAAVAMVLAGCARVQEPWDHRDHFKQERARSPEQEKQLRERALEGETDRHMGIQQVNRTS
jgi:protein involved in sex pheromone biosynthesis